MDDKHTKYQKAGLGRRIGFGERPAILIVDFNKGCLAKDSPLPPLMDLDDQVARTRSLIDLARESGTLVIYTTLGPYREDMQDAGPLGFKVPGLRIFGAGSKWAEIDDRLEVRAEDYLIWKKWQSSFHGTDLASILGLPAHRYAGRHRLRDERMRARHSGRRVHARIPRDHPARVRGRPHPRHP